jgi:hypothetical protein
MSELGDNCDCPSIWRCVCNLTKHKPKRAIQDRGRKNEKDTGKKGIEAEHREAVEGQPGQTVDHTPKAPNSVNVF